MASDDEPTHLDLHCFCMKLLSACLDEVQEELSCTTPGVGVGVGFGCGGGGVSKMLKVFMLKIFV